MSETVTVVYEQGVLRPLKPLSLPEQTHLQIQIVEQVLPAKTERQRVRQALLEAGVIQSQPLPPPVKPVSESDLAVAAKALAAAGNLSDLIIAEREDR